MTSYSNILLATADFLAKDKAQNVFVIWCAFHWGQYHTCVLVLYTWSHRSFLSLILRSLRRIRSAKTRNLSLLYQLYRQCVSAESTTSWAKLGLHLYLNAYVVRMIPHRGRCSQSAFPSVSHTLVPAGSLC